MATEPAFQDVRVRRAFNLAVDRRKLVKYTLQGEGDPAVHGLMPTYKGYDNTTVKGFDFDPDEARSLMKQAGFPDGKGFPKLDLHINQGGSINVILAGGYKNMLKENIGVEINVIQEDQNCC